jgi:hypothetical protein
VQINPVRVLVYIHLFDPPPPQAHSRRIAAAVLGPLAAAAAAAAAAPPLPKAELGLETAEQARPGPCPSTRRRARVATPRLDQYLTSI